MLREKSREIRQIVLDTCVKAGTGHVTSSLSATDILVALYYGDILRHDPKRPDWPDRDRFFLSKGQASPLLYAVLADRGFFPKSALQKFAQKGGRFGVHLQNSVPGVEITCGSLGQGFGMAVGSALAAKMDRHLHMVFALLGDGECYEGSIWEAAMFAAHNRLNNLIAIVDRNYQCVTDFTENIVALEPMVDRWASFGWNVVRVNGHNHEELMSALCGYRSRRSTQPLMIIADTVKGKGIDFISCVPLWHARAPAGADAIRAKQSLLKENCDE
jgi:transketolase